MTCSSTSSLDLDLLELRIVAALSPEDLITSSTPQALISSAQSAGKSTLRLQWLEAMAAQHLGEQSQLAVEGVLPHSSTTILQAASTSR